MKQPVQCPVAPLRDPATGRDPASVGWVCRDRVLDCAARPLVMGIVNVTPDSFSDGGDHADVESAVSFAMSLLEQGADILDIGGESTRPGALPVAPDAEIGRISPVIRLLAERTDAVLSVDTRKAVVARRALAGGAHIVNDISALGDPEMAAVVRDTGAGLVLMHMQGEPASMQANPSYGDVVAEVTSCLKERLAAALAAGIDASRVVLDPGIGFGKTTAHNLALLAGLGTLCALGRPVLIGLSRKRFLGELTGGRAPRERLAAGLAATAVALWQGARVVRTHDVGATRDAVAMVCALREGE